jgi:hypothetical protein
MRVLVVLHLVQSRLKRTNIDSQILVVSYSYDHVVRVDRKSKTQTSKSCLRILQATSHHSYTPAIPP